MKATARWQVLALLAGWLCAMTAGGAMAGEIERPFVLWNKADIEHMQKLLKEEPLLKAKYEQRLKESGRDDALFALYRFAVMGDKEAGEKQKERLLRVIRSKWPLGGAQWLTVVRYDLLYDMLTAAEREEVEEVFRKYIQQAIHTNDVLDGTGGFNDEANYSRYDASLYTKSNWLPNIVFPRRISANLMAAAIGDEKLIRETWSAYGSLQWYFDEYLADSGYYSEEFSKMGATPGELILFCRAVERLGLNELGYGYRGRHGATMRGHIASVLKLGLPRVELHSDYPHYPMVTFGDLRGSGSSRNQKLPSFAFQHAIVNGFLPSTEEGEIQRWASPGAWGGEIRGDMKQWDGYSGFTPKMLIPLWFEAGHLRWPDEGFDYFLSQMRTPGQDVAVPSLYFGLRPIDPAKVKAPPARSYVAPVRGLAVLRQDESASHWESEAPAVALRLASPYAHRVNDAFAIVNYVGKSRHLFINRHVTPGYARSWTRSIQSHCGLQVGDQEPGVTYATVERHGYYKPVKFQAARSEEVYRNTALERALFLTDAYLFDVTHARALDGNEQRYRWYLHPIGVIKEAKGWLAGDADEGTYASRVGRRELVKVDEPWSITVEQQCALADTSKAVLSDAWYDRQVGVVVRMLGGQETTVIAAPTRVTDDPADAPSIDEQPQRYEVGGVTIAAERRADETMFAALYEPYEGGKGTITEMSAMSRGADHLAVRIEGRGVDDRVLLGLGERVERITVAADDEQYIFANHAWIRYRPGHVDAWGDLRFIKVKVQDANTRFTLNGRTSAATIEDGYLVYKQ